MNYIFDKIKDLKVSMGNSAQRRCGEDIKDIIKSGKNGRQMRLVDPKKMVSGTPYFVFYDLSGKSSKMEQFSVVYHVTSKTVAALTYNFSICLNFIPTNIRIALFGNMLKAKEAVLLQNEKEDTIEKEDPLLQLSYEQMYKVLYAVGFEYSIRQFELPRIDRVYQLSTTLLPKILLAESSTFSGVPDSKLADIWSIKITEQDKRHAEQVNKLMHDYENMASTIESLIKDTSVSIENTKNAINNLSAFYKK